MSRNSSGSTPRQNAFFDWGSLFGNDAYWEKKVQGKKKAMAAKKLPQILALICAVILFVDGSVRVYGQDDNIVAEDNEKAVFFPGLKVTGEGNTLWFALSIRKYPGKIDHPYRLLNSGLYSKQIELTDDQLSRFQNLKTEIEYRAREYGTFTYDELEKKETRDRDLDDFVKEIEEFSLNEIDDILLPHQKELMRNFARREEVKKKSFVEVITAEPIRDELELSESRVAILKKKEKKLTGKYSKAREKATGKYRRELVAVLPKEKRLDLERLLGKEFFDGKSYVLKTNKAKDQIGVPYPKLAGEKLKVVPHYISKNLLFNHPFTLLSQKQIQSEVEIDEQQFEQFAELFEALKRKHREFFETDEYPHIEKSRMTIRIIRQSPDEIEKILREPQVLRVRQIYNQLLVKQIGFGRFLNLPSVVASLELSQDEIKLIEDNRYELQRKRLLELAEHERDFRNELINDLKQEQKEKLNEIFGASFFGE